MRTTLVALALVCMGAMFQSSGPPVGEKLGDFRIRGVLGAHAEKEIKFAKETEKKPGIVFFVHKLTRPTLRLMRPIDEFAAGEPKVYLHFVFLAEKQDDMEAFLKRAEKSLNLQAPVGISLDGKEGPNGYGLNDQVGVTILVADAERKVTANFAIPDPNETDARKVLEALRKQLPK